MTEAIVPRINTRILVLILVTMCVSSCIPFGFSETPRGWVVKGQFCDAQSGECFENAQVAVRLVRDGLPSGDDGFARTGGDGEFEAYVLEGFSSAPVLLGIMPVLGPSLGPAPDAVELLVRTDEGEASVTIPVRQSQASELSEFTGSIQLTSISVTLEPRVETTYETGKRPTSLALGDLDGDGHVDIVVTTRNDFPGGEIAIFVNQGDGSFAEFFAVGDFDLPNGLEADDLDGDGDLDLAVLVLGDNSVAILTNDGGMEFSESNIYPRGGASLSLRDFAIEDFNGDGRSDLIAAVGPDNRVTVLLNNGDATFSDTLDFFLGDAPSRIVVADFNGDGASDLAVSNATSSTVTVLPTTTNGGFESLSVTDVGMTPGPLVPADLDGDGDMDIAVLNRTDDNVSVLLNRGNGAFDTGESLMTGSEAARIAAGDLNADDCIDLAVVETTNIGNVLVYINDCTGSFREAIHLTAGVGARDVAVANLDGDRFLDLVVANFGSTISVFLNPLELESPDGDAERGRIGNRGRFLAKNQRQTPAAGNVLNP